MITYKGETIHTNVIESKAPNGATIYSTVMRPMDVMRSVSEYGVGQRFKHHDREWAGASYNEVKTMLERGALAEVEKVVQLERNILKKLQACVTSSAMRPGVYGGTVSVPAALAGHPKAFRKRSAISKAGIKVFINMSYSEHYSHLQVQKNIVAYLTLARVLTKTHNVELNLVVTSEGNSYREGSGTKSAITIPIGLSPFNWSQLAALSHCGTYRQWGIATTIAVGQGGISEHGGIPSTDLRFTFTDVLKIRPQDLCLNGMLLGESRPEEWVAEQLNRIREGKHLVQDRRKSA